MSVAMATSTSNCLIATLPGILDLGKCLKTSLDLCTATVDDILEAVIKLVQCLVSALTTINVVGALSALIDIISVVLSVLGINLSSITRLLTPLCAVSNVRGCKKLLSGDYICSAPINISLPGNLNLGQCLTDTLILCEEGKPATDAVLVKLVEALACLLNELLGSASSGVLDGLVCTVLELLTGAAANVSLLLKLALGSLAASIQLTVKCD